MKGKLVTAILVTGKLATGGASADSLTLSGAALQGVGFAECSKIEQFADRQSDLGIFHQWFLGFWVSQNIQRARDGMSAKDLATSLTSYSVLSNYFIEQCRKHKDDILFNVMTGFYESLPDEEIPATE